MIFIEYLLIISMALFAIMGTFLISSQKSWQMGLGYLLPRMAFIKNWAPVVNGLLFGRYHFWQPHNILATAVIGILLA